MLCLILTCLLTAQVMPRQRLFDAERRTDYAMCAGAFACLPAVDDCSAKEARDSRSKFAFAGRARLRKRPSRNSIKSLLTNSSRAVCIHGSSPKLEAISLRVRASAQYS